MNHTKANVMVKLLHGCVLPYYWFHKGVPGAVVIPLFVIFVQSLAVSPGSYITALPLFIVFGLVDSPFSEINE